MKKVKAHFGHIYLIQDIRPIFVDVIGCGGTGSNVLRNLARIHAALRRLGKKGLHVNAYDPDTINTTNIGRQNFYPNDLGGNKAVLLIQRINRAFGTSWMGFPSTYNRSNARTMGNIIITCIDKVTPRFDIGKTFDLNIWKSQPAEDVALYWMDIGNAQNSGQVVLGSKKIPQPASSKEYITTERLRRFDELFKLESFPEDQDNGPSCSTLQALNNQGLFINSIMAELACDLIWKLFFDHLIDYQGVYYNGDSMLISKIPIK